MCVMPYRKGEGESLIKSALSANPEATIKTTRQMLEELDKEFEEFTRECLSPSK